jgi:O-antigen/teichoic acid export membrane protein
MSRLSRSFTRAMFRADGNDPPELWTRLMRRARGNYDHSVFRRTAILLCLIVPAFLANFAVVYFGAELMNPADFGIFYVANTTGNVLFSASLILNMFFSRHLVAVIRAAGEPTGYAALARIERLVIGWGAGVSLVVFLAMLAISRKIGVQSEIIALLIVLDAYTSYVADLGRAMLQSLRRTFLLGSYTLVWMVARFAFCMIGIFAFHAVWGALAGIVSATVVIYAGFRFWTSRSAQGAAGTIPPLPPLASIVPAILGFGLLIAVSNLDTLVSYVLLHADDLGIYSASSIFPKAMLVVTLPLLQMLFPMMIGGQPADRAFRGFLRKSGVAMFGLATSGLAAIWLLSPWICGGRWGMKLCATSPLHILLLSVLPLVFLRVMVLLQFARGHDWRALWLGIPTVVYLWIALISPPSITLVATQFSVFSAAASLFLLGVHLASEWLNKRRPA